MTLDAATMCAESWTISSSKLARNANPLALVAVAQHYLDEYNQTPKSHKTYAPSSRQTSSSRSHTPIRTKGKEIAKPVTPLSESTSNEDNDLKQAQRDKDINKTVDNSLRSRNDRQSGQFRNQRTVTVAGAKETVDNQGVPTAELGPTFDVDSLEKVDSNVIPNSSDMCNNDDKDDQNDEEYEDERVVLANLIGNLKHDTDKNKKIQKQLKKENASLTHELKECKSALTESNDIRDRCKSALHQKEVPYHQDDLANIFAPNSNETLILEKENLLMPLAEKRKANANEFEKALKEEMFDHLQYIQSLEKELDELQSDKTEFSNKYDLLLQECLTKDLLCTALSSMTDIDKYSEISCKYIEKNQGIVKNNIKMTKFGNSKNLLHFEIVQIILFIVHSGYTKDMTGNFKLLCNFVDKFLGTVKRIENEAKTVRGTVAVRGGRHVSTMYCSKSQVSYSTVQVTAGQSEGDT
ncbi:hypothetical protein Tco_0693068 [Tanacetum coccineum]